LEEVGAATEEVGAATEEVGAATEEVGATAALVEAAMEGEATIMVLLVACQQVLWPKLCAVQLGLHLVMKQNVRVGTLILLA
jgi:hypothetical protein